MKEKHVPSAWIVREGRRLDCGPYLSGAMEARMLLERLPAARSDLCALTRGHEGGIYNGPQFVRNYVSDPEHGVRFLTGSSMLHADFTHADLLKKSDASSARLAHLRLDADMTLMSCSGTIGRTSYARLEMSGMWSSQDVLKIAPDPARVRPGYLYAFLSGRFGLPLLTGGTYGAIVQHVEPRHVARAPVPLAPDDVQDEAHRLVTEAAALRTKASAELRVVVRAIEQAAGLPPIGRRSGPASPDTALVRAGALRGRMDGLFHGNWHRAALEPLAALPAARRTTVGALAERVFWPPMFKRIPVEDPRFGLPFFGTSALMRSDPEAGYLLARRTPGFENLIVDETTVLVPASGQLNGIIGHAVLPYGDVVGATVTHDAMRLFSASEAEAGYLFACLSSEYGRRQLKARAFGSSIPHLDEPAVAGVVLPRLDDARTAEFGRRAFAVRTARHDAIGREREARAVVERWIEERAAA